MNALSPLVDTATGAIRVLHVDDEPDFADLTATYLEREEDHFEVTTATRAGEGLDLLAREDFDCIVSDYDMPGTNGIEFLETVREQHPDLPFILFTGKGSEEVASDAISAGVTDYLQKEPGTDQYAVLANRVSNATEHYRSRRMVERSERRLREIIDALPHPLYVASEDGRYLLANDALASFHGTTVDALEGRHVGDVLDEPVADRLLSAFGDVLDSGARKRLREIAITDAEGEEHVFEPHLVPYELGDADGRAVLGVAVDVTERQQRECELERTRERMQLALEHTGSVVYEIDLDTGGVVRHGAYEQFFDLSPGDVPTWDDHLDRAVHPDDRERFRQFYERLVGGEREGGTLEYRTHPRGGDVRWIRDTISVRTPSAAEAPSAGETRQAIGIAHDVTELKERELELRRKERRYRAVFDDPNILVGLIDTDGTVLDVNRTAMDYVEPALGEIVGDPFWETPWFDRSGEVQREIRESIDRAASGEYVEFETDLVRPNGEPYTVEGVFRPVVDDGGEVVSLLVSDRDVTERKERERELQRYEAYLEGSTDIITVLDTSGTITYQSPAVERILGYEADEFVGRNGFEFVHPDDEDDVYGTFTDLVAEPGATVTTECRFRTADGEWRWLEVRGTNRLEHDAIDGIVTNNRDITRRKERERALERERDRLDEFASVVSHDLRNPLNVAEARLEFAREECESEHLDAIGTALDRIDRIIEGVLRLGREGRDVGSVKPIPIRDAVDRSWKLVADDANRAELRYASDDGPLPTIQADDDRLCQLLENLFGNAIEHGGEGVAVTVGALADGFYVEDDGPGIPEEEHEDVFDAGYSRNEGGTGFGLRIVEQVVEGHGWDIRLTGGSGGGARFEITGVEFAAR